MKAYACSGQNPLDLPEVVGRAVFNPLALQYLDGSRGLPELLLKNGALIFNPPSIGN